jgi:hypothetical protein
MRSGARARPGGIELAACGADRGAAALEVLVGGAVGPGPAFEPDAGCLAGYDSGVWFVVSGAVQGALALLLGSGARGALLEALGPAAAADPASALAEVANIVASQAVTAMAERLGAAVTLSIPELAVHGAGAALAARASGASGAFASELSGPGAELRLLFVLLPGAAPAACDTVGT